MAPIELEFGHIEKLGDSDREVFIHGDSLRPRIVNPGVTEQVDYRFRLDADPSISMQFKAKVQCSNQDDGGTIEYELKQLGTFPNTTLESDSLPVGSEPKTKRANHPKRKDIVLGFRVQHIAGSNKK